MKKIIHLVDSMERGGQEKFILDLAISQKKKGFDVIILCLFKLGVFAKLAIKNKIQVYAVSEEVINYFQRITNLKKILDDEKPDVLHTHNRSPLIFSVLAKPYHSYKLINTRHGNGVRGLYWSLSALFADKIINVSSDLFTESNLINRFLIKSKNRVIKNGIEINDKISNGTNIGQLIIVGRLNPIKNHLLALNIVAECVKQCIPIKLLIVGDGPSRSEIEKHINELKITDNVQLLGDRADVNELLLESDIFLLTSFSEGHSIALLEASASGLPALVTNVGGNAEIIQNKITGWVFDLAEISKFVLKIKELIRNRDLRHKTSLNAKEWALNNVSIDACADRYIKEYFS
tara:strand:- start:293 stop:1336 length:1044 start_codon:yes stop_codon:yes gene_type:complete